MKPVVFYAIAAIMIVSAESARPAVISYALYFLRIAGDISELIFGILNSGFLKSGIFNSGFFIFRVYQSGGQNTRRL